MSATTGALVGFPPLAMSALAFFVVLTKTLPADWSSTGGVKIPLATGPQPGSRSERWCAIPAGDLWLALKWRTLLMDPWRRSTKFDPVPGGFLACRCRDFSQALCSRSSGTLLIGVG
jgi:hypothetical protein